MVKSNGRTPGEIELEVDKFSLLDGLSGISSFNGGNSREILLFRYPEKKSVKL